MLHEWKIDETIERIENRKWKIIATFSSDFDSTLILAPEKERSLRIVRSDNEVTIMEEIK